MLEQNFQAADLGGNNSVSQWRLHWLEAEGELQPWRTQIISEIKAGRTAISRLISPPRLDILVQRRAGAVIPEIGMVGRAYRKSLFALTFDPDNERFSACLSDGSVRRQVAHEVHHCLRMAGPGYGDTLGEVLVSEGLAGRFVGRLFGSPPEPWERAVDDEALRVNHPDLEALRSTTYDHAAWFVGAGGLRPRWLGYTLGYEIVGKWLDGAGEVDGITWINVPAHTVLSATWGECARPILLPG
jgi:hypothetical protein